MKQSLRNFVISYLTLLARVVIYRFKPRFIVITGTAGKTTTKQAIHYVLREKFGHRVAQSYGSMGTIIGLPLALLGFKPNWVCQNQVGPPTWQWPGWLLTAGLKTIGYLLGVISYPNLWVLEFTADKPGDFDRLVSYVRPMVVIVTNIGAGHLEYFGDEAGVAKEKSTIVRSLTKNGFAILNWHDNYVRKMVQNTQAKIYWVRAKGLDFAPAAARIVGRIFGLKYTEIERGLLATPAPAHRFEIFHLKSGVTVVDSTYNANPVSVMAVLQKVHELAKGRTIAVLGDMLELGDGSRNLHVQVGKEVRHQVDILLTIGDLAYDMNGDYHAHTADEALKKLRQIVKRGDTIVVKASHGMRLDRLVEKLKSSY